MSVQLAATLENQLLSALAPSREIDAVLLYGSVARGDVESHSDLDVLLVSNTSRKGSILRYLDAFSPSQYPNKLSITIYTHDELRFLASVKSLFLLHLKNEAIVLLDRSQGFLRTLLNDFEPKKSYRSDFEKSLKLLAPLRAYIPESPNQLHRLSQIYAVFRVFGVYLLAEKGIYEFSKDKMSGILCQAYPELAQSVRDLSKLRALNNLFIGDHRKEADAYEKCDQFSGLRSCLTALERLAGQPFALEQRTFADAVDEFLFALSKSSSSLNYELKSWFLLLTYDGLNIFFRNNFLPTLTGFRQNELADISSSPYPEAVRSAACEVLNYLQNYPLKYFLSPSAKIPGALASQILTDLVQTVG